MIMIIQVFRSSECSAELVLIALCNLENARGRGNGARPAGFSPHHFLIREKTKCY
jgi:hypothetical protein